MLCCQVKPLHFLFLLTGHFCKGPPFDLLRFWPCGAFWALISFHFGLLEPFGPSFPFLLAFWAFISFHFGLLWLFGPSFPFILAFWAFISFHFGLLGLHFLAFWPFGPSFPCILTFGLLKGVSFTSSRLAREPPPTSCQAPLEKLQFYLIDLTAPSLL